jgi:hypothetical protein
MLAMNRDQQAEDCSENGAARHHQHPALAPTVFCEVVDFRRDLTQGFH